MEHELVLIVMLSARVKRLLFSLLRGLMESLVLSMRLLGGSLSRSWGRGLSLLDRLCFHKRLRLWLRLQVRMSHVRSHMRRLDDLLGSSLRMHLSRFGRGLLVSDGWLDHSSLLGGSRVELFLLLVVMRTVMAVA
jgi:hypothetical protein